MSKLNKTITLSLAFMSLVLTACQKEAENTTIKTDVQQFEAVWNELNDTYVFWSVDTTDWDAVYAKYHPIFEEMENERDFAWVKNWIELTSTLLDHHLTIELTRRSTNKKLFLSPGEDEVNKRYYHHYIEIHHEDLLNKLVECGRLVDTTTHSFVISGSYLGAKRCFYSGILEQTIAYMHIPSFLELQIETTKCFDHFKQLVASESIKAAIIDVRDNIGGDSRNLSPLLSCFITEPVLIGYSQTKFGLGKYDLSPKIQFIVYPSSNAQNRQIPIIVLTNINSVSMAELTAIALRHLPQCYVVGERTVGATGGASDYTKIKESNEYGYVITTAEVLFEGVDGTIYEGYGVEPDIECLFDKDQWNKGIDNQLEMAISFAKNKIAENGNK